MKKILTAIVTMVVVMMIGGVTVQAGEKVNENRVKRYRAGYEADIADCLSDNEAKARAIEYDVNYKKLTGDIYDIYVTFTIYKKYKYEYHFIYDSEDDSDLTDYGINDNGKRVELVDLNDYLEDKFPELM